MASGSHHGEKEKKPSRSLAGKPRFSFLLRSDNTSLMPPTVVHQSSLIRNTSSSLHLFGAEYVARRPIHEHFTRLVTFALGRTV